MQGKSRSAPRLRCLYATAALMLFGPLTAATQDESERRLSRLKPHMSVQSPNGDGPFPVMVMVSGCSGFHSERFRASYDRIGSWFVESGFVVIRADYLQSHNLENSCVGPQNPAGEVVPDDEIAADVLATVEYAASFPNINLDQLNVIGWSLGGRGILAALAAVEAHQAGSISAAITYFPACDGLEPWNTRIPLLMLLAAHDNIAPPSHCKDLVANLATDQSVELYEYPDAHHCFSTRELPIVTEARPEKTCAYSPDADKASWQQILKFLDKS